MSVASLIVHHCLEHGHVGAGDDGRVLELTLREGVNAVHVHSAS